MVGLNAGVRIDGSVTMNSVVPAMIALGSRAEIRIIKNDRVQSDVVKLRVSSKVILFCV